LDKHVYLCVEEKLDGEDENRRQDQYREKEREIS
jgi:hypothetical protein